MVYLNTWYHLIFQCDRNVLRYSSGVANYCGLALRLIYKNQYILVMINNSCQLLDNYFFAACAHI